MRIIDQMQYEKKISNTFREVIQGRGNEVEYRQVLGQRYDMEGTFLLFCFNVKKTIEEETNLNQALFKLENLFGLWKGNKKINISYGLIRMEDSIVLVLNNMEHKYFMDLPDLILQSFKYFVHKHCFYLGIGPSITGIENLSVSYKRARTAMKMAMGTNREIVKFDEMGFFKVLYSIEDTEILSNYANEILGALERYDKAHNSSYVETLRSYIKNDRSIIRVAEDTYTHRNTVNYRIQKMKQIIGCELKEVDELFRYQVAFYIRDMEKR
jgi:sugar diacid utilization regulator